jgi:hypothetical protein
MIVNCLKKARGVNLNSRIIRGLRILSLARYSTIPLFHYSNIPDFFFNLALCTFHLGPLTNPYPQHASPYMVKTAALISSRTDPSCLTPGHAEYGIIKMMSQDWRNQKCHQPIRKTYKRD